MYRFIIASLAFLWIGTSHAMIINDFTGPYSASNWTTSSTGGGITVDNSNPAELVFKITGAITPRFEDHSTLTYTTTMKGDGTLAFDWNTGGIFFDTPAPYLQVLFEGVVATPPYLSFVEGMADSLQANFGHVEFDVKAGQTFTINVMSFSFGLQDDFRFRINGFSAPVPEPGIILLMGLGLIGLITTKRRKV